MPPSLSVVIPVYNEAAWIGTAVADADVAIGRAALDSVEFVIVDDGSEEATQDALASLRPRAALRVLRQANMGRLAARRTGLRAATGELTMLLDSRVSIRPGALAFVMGRIATDPAAVIWTAHVDIDLHRNPFARFWNVITEAAWSAYFNDPRTTSYGLDDFDRFPKGTTCFVAPTDELLAAFESFESRYSDSRNANDDTTIIRQLAARHRINISPEFSCLYRSRDAFVPFIKHAFHRGIVFVDGLGRRGTRYLPVVLAFYPASLGACALVIWRPILLVPGALLICAAAAAFGVARKRPGADVGALALLSLPWLGAFGAGMWRGLWLLASARLARARRGTTGSALPPRA